MTVLVLRPASGATRCRGGRRSSCRSERSCPCWLVAFVARERRAPEPVLPLRLLRNPILAVAAIVNGLAALLFFLGVYFLPVFFQQVKGISPTRSGLMLYSLHAGGNGGGHDQLGPGRHPDGSLQAVPGRGKAR